MHFDPLLPPYDILGPLFVVYWIFVASLDATDMISHRSMAEVINNSGQDIDNYSADTWKMTLYDLYLLGWGKGIGMSCKKSVGYRFPILKIHVNFCDIMRTRDH